MRFDVEPIAEVEQRRARAYAGLVIKALLAITDLRDYDKAKIKAVSQEYDRLVRTEDCKNLHDYLRPRFSSINGEFHTEPYSTCGFQFTWRQQGYVVTITSDFLEAGEVRGGQYRRLVRFKHQQYKDLVQWVRSTWFAPKYNPKTRNRPGLLTQFADWLKSFDK